MAAPTISNSKNTTATKFGGDALNFVNRYLNGSDVTSQIGTPIIRTPTKIPSDILMFTDPAEDNTVTVKIPSLSTDKNINLIPSNVDDDDEPLYRTTVQEVEGKVISAGTNTITGLTNDNLSGSAGITDTNLAQITDTAKLPTGLLFATNTITLTNKTHDFKDNIWLRLSRYGCYNPGSNSTATENSYGALKGMVGLGVQTTNVNTGGKHHVWSTVGGVVNDVAGVVKLDNYTAWRLMNPIYRFAFLFDPNTGNTRRMFKGWGAQRLLSVDTNTEPLLSTESGFLFGHGSNDTAFQIFHNDGSGVCVKTPTSVNLPGAITNYILEISADNTAASFTWTLYSVNSVGIRGTMVTNGTGTITTDIPAQNTGLYPQDLVVGTTTATQTNKIHYHEVFQS